MDARGPEDLGDMSGAELLDHVDVLAQAQRRCEVEILRAAVQHAVIHNPESIEPWQLKAPGGERPRRFGGAGTPLVAEFSPATLAARLGVSTYAGRELMADGLDLAHRLPQTWARVEALEVKASYARLVARKTRDLTEDQAGYVDERVCESADGRIPWTRFEALVEAMVTAADPEGAAKAEAAEAMRQFANPTASDRHGMRGFYIRSPFAVIAKFDAAVAFFADLLARIGDTDPEDVRRVKAVLILANPAAALDLLQATYGRDTAPAEPVDWSQFLPAVTVYVHLYGGPDGDGIARITGAGHLRGTAVVTEAWVREHLGKDARFTIRPVHDIEGQAPVDAWEIPERHRRAVQLMTPADTFPYAPNTDPRDQQIDHTEPFDPNAPPGAGQSRVGNYGPLTITHHRIKTFGGWQVRQPFPGIYLWQDPYGATYLVDHTGTRRLRQEKDEAA